MIIYNLIHLAIVYSQELYYEKEICSYYEEDLSKLFKSEFPDFEGGELTEALLFDDPKSHQNFTNNDFRFVDGKVCCLVDFEKLLKDCQAGATNGHEERKEWYATRGIDTYTENGLYFLRYIIKMKNGISCRHSNVVSVVKYDKDQIVLMKYDKYDYKMLIFNAIYRLQPITKGSFEKVILSIGRQYLNELRNKNYEVDVPGLFILKDKGEIISLLGNIYNIF